MKRKFVIFMLLSPLFFTKASIMPPKPVEPVEYQDLMLTVNHEKPGFIQAIDKKSGLIVWEKKIYLIFYNPFLEKDVQIIFIRTIRLEGDLLYIENTRKKQYVLNLKTRQVKKAVFDSASINS